MRSISQPDRESLLMHIKLASNFLKGRCLDVGSGSFNRYHKFFKNCSFTTLDVIESNNPDIVASAEKIPLDSNSVDSVLCTQVLEHVKNPQDVLIELNRVLKKGGKIFLTVPAWNEIHEAPHDYFRYTEYGLKEMFKKANFKNIEIIQRGGYHALEGQMKIRYYIERFNLYNNKFYNFMFSIPLLFYSKYKMFRDKNLRNNNPDLYRKFPLGYSVKARK